MTYKPAALRAPIVMDTDREWAIAQKPADWDDKAPMIEWTDWVFDQAARFEAYFAEDRKTHAQWSSLWRNKFFPEGDMAKHYPAKKLPHVPHPFIKQGQPGWEAVMAACSPSERQLAERFGVMQFRPDDPRAEIIARAA